MQDVEAEKLSITELCQRSIQNFFRHSMLTYASALAYQGLFALFPFLIFVSLLLIVLQVDGFFDRLIDQAYSQPPQQLSTSLESVVEQARASLPEEAFAPVAERLARQGQEVSESKLLPFGVIFFAIWSASGVAWTLFEALNVVHEVQETRPLWKRFSLSLVFAPVLGVMVIVGGGLLLIGPQLAEWLAGHIGLDEAFAVLWWWLRIPVALFLLMLTVTVVYYFVPNTNRPFRFVVPGAVVAVIAWALALLGFSFYVFNFASYSVVYGSLAAAIALLVYLYLSAAALLLGAEVNEAVYRFASQTECADGG